MYMVHAAFQREFGALPGLVRNVQAGNVQRAHTMSDHIARPPGWLPPARR